MYVKPQRELISEFWLFLLYHLSCSDVKIKTMDRKWAMMVEFNKRFRKCRQPPDLAKWRCGRAPKHAGCNWWIAHELQIHFCKMLKPLHTEKEPTQKYKAPEPLAIWSWNMSPRFQDHSRFSRMRMLSTLFQSCCGTQKLFCKVKNATYFFPVMYW